DVGPVLVAAGESEIAAVIEAAGGKAVLTRPELPSGSDRIWEALLHFDAEARYDVIVNLQGDLPMLDPGSLQSVLNPLGDPAVDIATLAVEIRTAEERDNPNIVKAVAVLGCGRPIARALYFKRFSLPCAN